MCLNEGVGETFIHQMKALFKTDSMTYITPPHNQRGPGHGRQHLGHLHEVDGVQGGAVGDQDEVGHGEVIK